jgi:hypothetical protein
VSFWEGFGVVKHGPGRVSTCLKAKAQMKRVFISHPYKDDPKGNKKQADTICRGLAEKDDIFPISPLHLFSFMKDDSNREEILQVCFRLIDICDEVWIYGDSEGCRMELEHARSIGKVVRVHGGNMGKAKG